LIIICPLSRIQSDVLFSRLAPVQDCNGNQFKHTLTLCGQYKTGFDLWLFQSLNMRWTVTWS